MRGTLNVLKDKGMEMEGIEGTDGLFNRIYTLRRMLLKEMLEPSTQEILQGSNQHKILVVTHDRVMKALTSSKVVHNPKKVKTLFNSYDLVGGRTFTPCEMLPYHIHVKYLTREEAEKLMGRSRKAKPSGKALNKGKIKSANNEEANEDKDQ